MRGRTGQSISIELRVQKRIYDVFGPPETYRVVTELVGEEVGVEVDGHEGLVVGVVPVDAVVQDGHERGQVGQDLRGPFHVVAGVGIDAHA